MQFENYGLSELESRSFNIDSVTLLSFILQIIFKQFFDEIYSKNWISMNHSISIFSIDAGATRRQ